MSEEIKKPEITDESKVLSGGGQGDSIIAGSDSTIIAEQIEGSSKPAIKPEHKESVIPPAAVIVEKAIEKNASSIEFADPINNSAAAPEGGIVAIIPESSATSKGLLNAAKKWLFEEAI